MSLWQVLVDGKDLDKVAIDAPDAKLTYAGLIDAAAVAAEALSHRGLRPGDRVAYLGLNSAALVVLVFACARAGLILVPLNWRLAAEELSWILEDADPALIVADPVHWDVARAISAHREITKAHPFAVRRPPTHPGARQMDGQGCAEDDVLLVYTSGTTGRPKGAVLTQSAVLANAVLSHDMHQMTRDDRVLTCLPMFHVGGLNIQTLPALLAGASVALMDRFEPSACLSLIERFRPTLTVQVPATMQALMELEVWDGTDLSSLRAIATGSTDVPLSIIDAVHTRGVPMIQIYGATETGPVVVYQRADEAIATAGSIGRPGPGVSLRITADGADVAPGDPGEIWLQSPTLARGYWRGRGDDAFVEGWFRTGDMARQGEDGFLWFTDRLKNVIISGGENIYPAELERILGATPGVEEAAVVGRADPKWGQVPVVVVAASLTRETILEAFTGRIARFKRPHDVVFVKALPRNAMGKVDLSAARALAGAG